MSESVPIVNYEDYLIHRDGCVFSKKSSKVLKNFKSAGYWKTTLCKNGKTKKKFIHRLIAEHFIPNPQGLPTVNHKNGIRTDNRVENLEWSCYSQQELHKKREIQGKKRGVYKTQHGKWTARIKNGDKYEHLGVFIFKEDAYNSFFNKYKQIHGMEPW